MDLREIYFEGMEKELAQDGVHLLGLVLKGSTNQFHWAESWET
jgi:hypothetical protein